MRPAPPLDEYRENPAFGQPFPDQLDLKDMASLSWDGNDLHACRLQPIRALIEALEFGVPDHPHGCLIDGAHEL